MWFLVLKCELGVKEFHDLGKWLLSVWSTEPCLFATVAAVYSVYSVCTGLEMTLSRLSICRRIKIRACKGLLRWPRFRKLRTGLSKGRKLYQIVSKRSVFEVLRSESINPRQKGLLKFRWLHLDAGAVMARRRDSIQAARFWGYEHVWSCLFVMGVFWVRENPSYWQLVCKLISKRTVLWLSDHALEHSLDILPKPVPSDFMVGVPFLETSEKSHQIMTDLLIA